LQLPKLEISFLPYTVFLSSGFAFMQVFLTLFTQIHECRLHMKLISLAAFLYLSLSRLNGSNIKFQFLILGLSLFVSIFFEYAILVKHSVYKFRLLS